MGPDGLKIRSQSNDSRIPELTLKRLSLDFALSKI